LTPTNFDFPQHGQHAILQSGQGKNGRGSDSGQGVCEARSHVAAGGSQGATGGHQEDTFAGQCRQLFTLSKG